MKKILKKHSLILFIPLIMMCFVPVDANAEEASLCYPSEEQRQMYKEDGTWEERQEYVKNLHHSAPSEELLYKAVQRNKNSSLYAAGDYIPTVWKGMQVTGDAKLLLVRVEFADVTFEDSKIYSEEELYNMVMGNEETGIFPYESLNAYYKRSSYNKLNITSDKVYTCTLSKERGAYEFTDTGEQELIKEVFELLDDDVDFADYDANHDGQIDGICINFAGETTGWGSTWWSHEYKFLDHSITFDEVTPAGYIFMETYPIDDSVGTQTLIHETGHLLGLPDYYSQLGEGIGTTDMMNQNSGDHNGFSKWLLGWIEDENILKINSSNVNEEVVLSPLASESLGDDKLIAVIAPEETSIYSEYFVVQYDEYMGNQSVYELTDPAYRVFHVNAELNGRGDNFNYDNVYAYDKYLIKAVSVVEELGGMRSYFREGDALTPDTNESSAFYGGNVLGFTGIELTDFKTGDSPSFSVSFRGKEVVDGKLSFEIMGNAPFNMMELILLSNKPLIDAGTYQEAYLEDNDGKQYPITLSFEDGSKQINTAYLSITNSLKPETEYTLVFPAGMFQIDKGVYSEECRLKVKTGVFPAIEAGDYTYEFANSTNIFNMSDARTGFIRITDHNDEVWFAELHMYEGTEELDTVKFNIPIPKPYSEPMTLKGVACYDGTIALEIRSGDPRDYSIISSYYKIDQNGKVLSGPFSITEQLYIFPAGKGLKGTAVNSGGLGAPPLDDVYKLEVYTIDFENEPVSRLVDMQKYMSKVYALDAESYAVIQQTDQGYKAGIYNNKDELITSMALNVNAGSSICAVVKSGDNLVVMHEEHADNDKYIVSVSEFGIDGKLIRTTEIITFQEWKSKDAWQLEKTDWGYSLYNSTLEQPYSIYFVNEELQLISSMQVPNDFASGAHMGSRYIVKWYDLETWRFRVAITEPIVGENTDEKEDPNEPGEDTDSLDPNNPPNDGEENEAPGPGEEGETTKTGGESDPPKTGDESNLLMTFYILILSCGIFVTCLRGSWLREHRKS